ncbi:MAG: tyrosine-type recombinase/integrase [Planctomycetota bacterium]|jgi:site-specific recombinase XerD
MLSLQGGLDAFLLAKRAECTSKHTASSYRTLLAPLVEYLGNPPIDQVTIADVRQWIVSLRERDVLFENHPKLQAREGKLSEVTIRNSVIYVKILFRWLYEEELIERNVTDRLKVPKKPRTHPPVLEPEQIIALVDSIDVQKDLGIRNLAILITLLCSGIRIGELCKLRLPNVNLETGRLHIKGKGNKQRYVFLAGVALRLLDYYIHKRRPEVDHDYVWVGRYGDNLKEPAVSSMLRRLKIRAGLENAKFSAHVLRHTYATYFVENGGDSRVLQDLIGHADLATTAIYTHPRGATLQQNAQYFHPLNGAGEPMRMAVIDKIVDAMGVGV